MNDIMESTQNIFLEFLNNENYINIISIIVVAITTYYVTKYTTLKPARLSIKQAQLENIYLPLYLILRDLPQPISQIDAISYYKKISNILNDHYVLAFPQLHQLNQMLKNSIVDNSDYEKFLRIMKHQVDIDYELLKKKLGYPSANFFNIFIRMTARQKVECITDHSDICCVLILCTISSIFKPYFKNDLVACLILTLLYLFSRFLLLIIEILVEKIEY